MKRNQSRAGFSIPELLAAMIAASVLLLLVGSLLYSSSGGWGHSLQVVQLRRDADATMGLLAHQIRTTSASHIAVSPDTNTLWITNALTGTWATFLVTNQTLYFRPNEGGGEITLVREHLATFEAVPTNGMVTIHLRLTNDSDVADVFAAYKCRN